MFFLLGVRRPQRLVGGWSMGVAGNAGIGCLAAAHALRHAEHVDGVAAVDSLRFHVATIAPTFHF